MLAVYYIYSILVYLPFVILKVSRNTELRPAIKLGGSEVLELKNKNNFILCTLSLSLPVLTAILQVNLG